MDQQSSQSTGHFEQDFAYIHALLDRGIEDATEAEFVLRQIYNALYNVNLSKYDVERVRSVAEDQLRALFALRLRLREQIPAWRRDGFITPTTEAALRSAFRAARYASDMLGELIQGHPRPSGDNDAPLRAFSGGPINTLLNPKFPSPDGSPQFRSGDVLLVRGGAHNSAAIARIGDTDTQFSHVGLIYVDEQGKPWVIEALIEHGSVINTLDHVLEHNLIRAVLFRHKNTQLAESAAKAIHKTHRPHSGRGWQAHPLRFLHDIG